MVEKKMVKVLDKGYVRIVDTLGSDLTPVNAARVSYNKESNDFNEKDEKLLKFLAREDHTSPFRHAMLQFEVYAPLMVARQWWKYVVGSSHQDNMAAWNESSRRYITEVPVFYVPKEDQWRSAPENSKQGSGQPLVPSEGQFFSAALIDLIEKGEAMYEHALKQGIAPEQARLFLPAYGMYVRWYWTASLSGVAHFLNQRLAHDSQHEIQVFAKAIKELSFELFPKSLEELIK